MTGPSQVGPIAAIEARGRDHGSTHALTSGVPVGAG